MTDQVLDFVEAMSSGDSEGEFAGIKWVVDPHELSIRRLRLIFPMNHETVSRGLHASFCEEVLTTLFSDSTNNDACFVTLRVRSAHFELYSDLPDWVKESYFEWIVVDGIVRDYLT